MPPPADYHMHTPLCRHATGEPTDYAARALQLGLTEIGVSEHAPMIRDDYDDWHMRIDDLDEYVEKVRRAQRDHPGLAIKLALEVDYLPGHEDWIRDLAARQVADLDHRAAVRRITGRLMTVDMADRALSRLAGHRTASTVGAVTSSDRGGATAGS